MEIKFKGKFVEMDFDTKEIKMLSIPSKPCYHVVDLALTDPDGKSMNIVIATFDFTESHNFENMQKLAAEIARRWNECKDKQ